MKFQVSALAVAAALLVTACGGGGGGGTTAATVPTAVTPPVTAPVTPPVTTTPVVVPPVSTLVAISTSNAKAIAAVALDATTYPFASLGTVGMLGIINNHALSTLFLGPKACTGGGSATVIGSLASPFRITPGDSLTANFTNCSAIQVLGLPLAMTGAFTSIFSTATATRLVSATTIENFTFNTLLRSYQLSGDQSVDYDGANASATIFILAGKSLAIRSTTAAVVRNTTWKDYSQAYLPLGSDVSFSLSSTIQTDNTNLSLLGGSFVITTTAPVIRSAAGLLTSGAISLVGASAARINVSVNLDGSATLAIDANGDGIIEATQTITSIEMINLL